jgi:hypothetical protein
MPIIVLDLNWCIETMHYGGKEYCFWLAILTGRGEIELSDRISGVRFHRFPHWNV